MLPTLYEPLTPTAICPAAPPTGLPNRPWRATSTSVAVPALPFGTVAEVCDASGTSGVTVTVSVPTVTPPATAEMSWSPEPVALKLPVVVPDASVSAGCPRVTPAPVAARVTDSPASGFPRSSCSTIVIVLIAEPWEATIVLGDAETLLLLALGGPPTEVAVKVTGLPTTPGASTVAVSV